MSRLACGAETWDLAPPGDEDDFERAVVDHASVVFGPNRLYLDCKRLIGTKSGIKNIPDGYLLDLTSKENPRLYVVENELSSHELFKHIGVQLLEFSVSFKAAPKRAREILLDYIRGDQSIKERCEEYAREAGLSNLDRMISYLVEDQPFRALVIIDEADAELYSLLKNFQFDVEVIEFETYMNAAGDRVHRFTPFQVDVDETLRTSGRRRLDLEELDTIVVPAREEGFQDTFLSENRWHAVRLSPTMKPQLQHIAAYRVAPVSAITHIAEIESIEPWLDTGKYCINFRGPAREIRPRKLVPKGRVKTVQGPRYTKFSRLEAAKNLDGVF